MAIKRSAPSNLNIFDAAIEKLDGQQPGGEGRQRWISVNLIKDVEERIGLLLNIFKCNL